MRALLVFCALCVAAVVAYRLAVSRRAAARAATPGARSRMPTPDSPYVRVFMTRQGALFVNGAESSLAELSCALDDLASRRGVVLYSRDAPEEQEPHPSAKAVIAAVVQRRLPIRLCRKADFSDGITPDGKLRVGG